MSLSERLHQFCGFNRTVSTKGFALFRIGMGLFLLAFISNLYYFRPLIFNSFLTTVPSPFPARIFLLIWGMAATFLLVGWQTRLAAIANYICVLIATFYFSNNGSGNFNDDLLRIGGVVLLIMPVNKRLSFDNVFHELNYGFPLKDETKHGYYLLSAFISLGLLYWASSITKLVSPMGLNGLGLWVPAVMPYNKWNDLSFFLNQKWLLVFINYLTMAWEFLFPLALFYKPTRLVSAWLGVSFHLIIALLFPFWLLCFGPVVFYALLIENRFWAQKYARKKAVQVGYNPDLKRHIMLIRLLQGVGLKVIHQPLHTSFITLDNRTYDNNWATARMALKQSRGGWVVAILLKSRLFRLLACWIADDVLLLTHNKFEHRVSPSFKEGAFMVFCLCLLSVQIFYSSYHLIKHRNSTPKAFDHRIKKIFVKNPINDASLKPSNLFRTFFGLNARGLFLDQSFTGTKPVFAITYQNQRGQTKWLPHFTPDGLCLFYNMNQGWNLYSYSAVGCGTIPNPIGLEQAIRFWALKHHFTLTNCDFTVLKRIYEFPTHFKRDYYQQQKALPWINEGTVRFRMGKFSYHPTDSIQLPLN